MPDPVQTSRIDEGLPMPLGATYDGFGTNFALFSANATKVELCLFDATGQKEIERIELPEYTNEVWHGYLPDVGPETVYGYRVYGPYEPEKGMRFNHNKLLLDPYARAHIGALKWGPEIFGYKLEGKDDLVFDERDSAPFVPKCRVVDPSFTWSRDRKPEIFWDRTVIYELHVRGFTKLHPQVPENLRGTFAALARGEVIEYIKSLGVTSIELMPVHTFLDDNFLIERGLKNYWGYDSIGFFAPDPRYSASGMVAEFKQMVAHFHDAGLEVILDVVYNHTAEGSELGPTLSFKGIDNASYYRLLLDSPRYYINDTGTGNTVNLSNPRVLQMVMDSLRYWVNDMHVDGFRFDLATILGRETHGFDQGGGFLDACRQDPVLAQVKLIAEPWDLGPGGYQVGWFSPGWAEWNDRFRDVVRSYWKGDEGKVAELATRLSGSADFFNKRGRKPWSSVNFVTVHDGFTLNDLVSYNEKHNEANGEDNKDGNSNNLSWNCGAEGPTDDAGILQIRRRQMRNMLATILFSQGTPLLLAGDEFARTQQGNNNAYCQDNEISWVNWDKIGPEGKAQTSFVRKLTMLRKALPVLRRNRYLDATYDEKLHLKALTWINATGNEMDEGNWQDGNLRCFGMLMDGRGQASGIKRPADDVTLLLVMNSHSDMVQFTLPAFNGGKWWIALIDTNEPERDECPRLQSGMQYGVDGRSLVLFAAITPGKTGQIVRRMAFEMSRAADSSA